MSIVPQTVEREVTATVAQHVQRALVEIEGEAMGASAELTYQRHDLAEAASDVNNLALAAALRVEGLPALARELIQTALAVEEAEDAAVARAERRRATSHGHTRAVAGAIERTLTGRTA